MKYIRILFMPFLFFSWAYPMLQDKQNSHDNFLFRCLLLVQGQKKFFGKVNLFNSTPIRKQLIQFSDFPQEIKEEIINYSGVAGDSPDEFKEFLKTWNYTRVYGFKIRATSYAERRKYGYNGFKVPIHLYTRQNNKPMVVEVGCILENAQPSMFNGFWYADSHKSTTRLFLHHAGKTYHNQIEPDTHNILGGSLSAHGDIALAWNTRTEKKLFITFTNLAAIKLGQPINLDHNKFEIDINKSELFNEPCELNAFKAILFNLKGSNLAALAYDDSEDCTCNCAKNKTLEEAQKRATTPTYVQFFDAPSKDKQLSAEFIWKQLGISKNIPQQPAN